MKSVMWPSLRCSARRSPKMVHFLARTCKLVHTQRIWDWNFAKIQQTVRTLLISFNRCLMQNIKHQSMKSLIYCRLMFLNFAIQVCQPKLRGYKRTKCSLVKNSILCRNPMRLYVWTNVKRTGCLFLQYFGQPAQRTPHKKLLTDGQFFSENYSFEFLPCYERIVFFPGAFQR